MVLFLREGEVGFSLPSKTLCGQHIFDFAFDLYILSLLMNYDIGCEEFQMSSLFFCNHWSSDCRNCFRAVLLEQKTTETA